MSETVQAPAPRRTKHWLLLLVALCLAIGGGAYWYKSHYGAAQQNQNGKNRPLPVAVAVAKTQDVEVFLTGLGTVSPLNSVTVKSRVDGQLMQVLFRDGQLVKAGDLLLVIDSRPFQVQLAQAEGQLKRDVALLDNARLDLKRYDDLIAQGAIARQQLDTQLSLVHQYEGAVASDKATADNARLQITYSRITAPVSGQVGMRLVDPGNMVHATDVTGLLVLNQISPINVLFTLPEDQLPRVLEKLRAGQTLRVDAYDREQTRKLAQGELASVDNQIDTGTGTVRLKASFANTGGELFPNQFVNAKLLVDILHDAVVVPSAAVQRGQQGTYLYVVTPENTASARPVSIGETGDGQVAILSGLAAGERVVVDGAERLRDGAAVEVKESGEKPAEGSEAAKPEAAKPADAPAEKPAAAKPEMATQNATAAAVAVKPAKAAKSGGPETAPAAKPESKPEQKKKPKAERKSEQKPDQQPETKSEPALETQAGSQPQAKP